MGVEMKSAVFFDIDGTIWNYDHYIPDSAKKAVRLLQENGHVALLCSGRARAFVNDPDLLSMGWDGIVCSCGNHIEINNRMMYERLIEQDEAVRIIEFIRSYGFKPILEGPEFLYMDEDEFPVGQEYADILRRDLGHELTTIGGANYGKWRINKFSCETDVPEEKRLECFKMISDKYDVIEHSPTVCEIIPKGANKATGMLKACEFLGVEKENTYALGDSENDLEMLRAAAHGIAMGNGTDRAKEAAEYVTTAFDQDGIYLALKHYHLI